MKRLITILLLLLLYTQSNGQTTVTGTITRTNGTAVKQVAVYMYSDTSVVNPIIPLTTSTTDTSGQFSFQISNAVPIGTQFSVSTLDCDNVTMRINNHIYAGNNINSPLKVCVSPGTDFSGYVYLGSASLRPVKGQAKVYLIQKCSGNQLSYIDSIDTDTSGYFSYPSYPTLGTGCELLIQAKLKSTSTNYKKYLPAYHESNTNYSLRWTGARDVPFNVAEGGVVIILPEAINPHGGPSKLAGISRNASGNILPGKVIFLTDNVDIPVDYLYATSIGDFAFINLPFGRYKLFGDVWGKDNPELVVKVDADGVYIDNIIFTESNTEYKGHLAVSVKGISNELSKLSIYPNPVEDMVYINGAGMIDGEKQIEIRSITGKLVAREVIQENQKLAVDVSKLESGLYLLHLSTNSGEAIFKLQK